ncbi:MAG: ATP-grasp domain-containing protein [Stackebrandtia sp.]
MSTASTTDGARQRPRLVVVYSFGSATATQILAASRGLCEVVFLADRSEPHVAEQFPLMRDVARVIDITGYDDARVVREVTAESPDGITTFSDTKVELAARLSRACELVGHRESTVRVVTDKLWQRRRLASAGVDATRFAAITHPADVPAAAAGVGFPAVLKPRRGTGARNTQLVAGADECASTVKALHGMEPHGLLLEEALIGIGTRDGVHADCVSVESIVQGGHITTLYVSGRFPMAEPMRETGMIVPADLPPAVTAPIIQLEQSALRALGIEDGLCHTEFKLTADGPRLIEVNARLGGPVGHLTKLALGFDVIRMGLDVALGHPVAVPQPKWRGVAFNHSVLPPPGVSRVATLEPLAELRELPGVVFCNERVGVGDRVDSRRGDLGTLATIVGLAESHADLASIPATVKRAGERMCPSTVAADHPTGSTL